MTDPTPIVLTDDPDVAREVAKKLVRGLAGLVRALVPTYQAEGNKRLHHRVGIVDNELVVGTDRAPYACVARLLPAELLVRKSTRRAPLGLRPLRIGLQYTQAVAWLKLYEASVRHAELGASGGRLAVAPGASELSLALRPEDERYAERWRERLARSVGEQLAGPFEVPADVLEAADSVVLRVDAEGARGAAVLEPGSPAAQLLFKPKLLAKSKAPATVAVHAGRGDSRVFCFRTEGPTLSVVQYFRTLRV